MNRKVDVGSALKCQRQLTVSLRSASLMKGLRKLCSPLPCAFLVHRCPAQPSDRLSRTGRACTRQAAFPPLLRSLQPGLPLSASALHTCTLELGLPLPPRN